ncbi:MAG: AAA domain-containing protein [Ferroplasma sp.]|uniref:AAA domain-containing protein n=1 Tax=Ferroplasma sp. TaxID=2591003 RepID=UPI002815EA6C|nr:AAA domain-containing protein [Ferroplasma sp.]WMT50538.1 MAG: AAA domain-containing protein [Ferroplasma sp.]
MERGQFNDYKDILYYSNLEQEKWNTDDQAFNETPYSQLKKYLSILTIYSKILKSKADALKFQWSRTNIPDGEAKELFAIQLNKPKHNESDSNYLDKEEILQQISEQAITKLISDDHEQKKREYIEIIDVYNDENEEYITLIVNKLPSNSIVIPDLSDLSLKRELAAIKKLMDAPENYLLPLLRLAGQKSDEFWSEPELVDVNEWKVLTDTTFPGIDDQRKMVRQALSTNDFAILEGPPGSGKTTVLSELILQLLLAKKRVLLVGSTHVAVDNVLEKIIKYTNIAVPIRMAHADLELPPEIMDLTYYKYIKSFKARLLKELLKLPDKNNIQKEWINEIQTDKNDAFITQLINDSINLVSGTTYGVLQFPEIKNCIKNGTFKPLFDVMIIDEASKTNFTEFLVPALFAKKWIISGDPKQLSPYTDQDFIVSEIDSLLQDEYKNSTVTYHDIEKVSLLAFWAYTTVKLPGNKPQKKALLILNDADWKLVNFILEQIKKSDRKIITHIIPEVVNNEELEKIMVNGSDIIIANSRFIQKYIDALPYGITICGNMSLGDEIKLINRFHFKFINLENLHNPHHLKNPHNVALKDVYEDGKLSKEIAWRLIRYYEMRKSPNKALLYKEQIRDLIPKFSEDLIGNKNKKIVDVVWYTLDNLKSAIFPSILDILISGNSSINSYYKGSVLESGLPAEYKKSVWTLLSYQYRMHPEISYYPRKLVYTSEDGTIMALKDTNKIDRSWNFKKYKQRVVWLHVAGKSMDKMKSKRQNINVQEADRIITELKEFVEFASKGSSEKNVWSVAIMSFYRNQTRELKKRIREYFTGKGSVYYNDKKSVKIFVGNVDAMQGREADIVYLSMVRTGGLGFLDNMNRINVAITRARYQLVIVGNYKTFENFRNEGTLVNKLAKEIKANYDF